MSGPKFTRSSAALGALILWAPSLAAQETPATSTPSPQPALPSIHDNILGDIVVTARRREENLRDVPVAITAFTGATLDARNIRDIAALDGIAPNVKVIESGSNTTSYLQIRGSVTTNPNPGYEPAAAMYIDGLYIGKAVGSTTSITDIDHIEVLRGPQGTLFGRNTLAGAVSITTKKPTGELGGTLKIGVGNFDRKFLQASVDLPAIGDLSIKLSGLWSKRDGYIRTRTNPFPAIPAEAPTVKRIGDERNQAFRIAARYQPGDALTFDYSTDYSKMNTTPLLGALQSVGEGGIFDPDSPAYVDVPLYLYIQPGERPRDTYGTSGVDGRKLAERVETWTHMLTATVDLGAAELKSITGYRTMDWSQSLDLDGTPLPIAAAGSDLDYKQFSQELQISGEVGQLTYTGGLFYFQDRGDSSNPQQFFGMSLESEAVFETRAYAAYAQIDWRPPILNERLVLTAGFRYSHEKKQVRRFASADAFITIPGNTRAKKSFSGSTPTFVAKYDLTDQINIYAKYSEGFKSGGFSTDATTAATATTPYQPELVKSIEFGTKAKLLDGRLSINAAAFFDKHIDQQIAIFTPTDSGFVTLTSNDADSKIKGFEIELQAAPVDGLLLTGSVGHADARFTRFFEVIGGPNVASTRAFAFVPRWIANASADVTLLKNDRLQINLAADVSHSSPYAALPYSTDPAVDPNIYSTKVDSSTTLDTRLTISRIPLGQASLQITGFVKNLTNEVSRTAGIDFGQSFGNIVTRNYSSPRTYGLDLSVNF